MFAKRFCTTLHKHFSCQTFILSLYNHLCHAFRQSKKDRNYNSDALLLVVGATSALKFKDARSSVY